MNKTEMLLQMIAFYTHGHKANFAQLLGIKPSALSTWISRGSYDAELIFSKCEGISSGWLLTGKGSMIIEGANYPIVHKLQIPPNTQLTDCKTPTIITPVAQCANASSCNCNVDNVTELPVIPTELYKKPDVDIMLELPKLKHIDKQPVIPQFPPGNLYYRFKSHSMEPVICPGDTLLLSAYEPGQEFVEPGCTYVVDTGPKGLITRMLFHHPDGYMARSHNPDRYPDFLIPHDKIIRVYEILGLLRAYVQ